MPSYYPSWLNMLINKKLVTHELKCDPEPFQAVLDGLKTAEFRKNDRWFEAGNKLILRETAPGDRGSYTGRSVRCTITDVTPLGDYGVPGYVLLSIITHKG
jgi:hypothetical protein